MKTLEQQLKKVIESYVSKTKTLQVYVESDLLSNPLVFETGRPNQKFHSASVGKLMTSVLVVQSIERGLIDWETNIDALFPPDELNDLFVYQGIDYQHQVTLSHLLSHTSGVHDYFEGKTASNISFIDQVLSDPNRFYTPQDLIKYTKEHQKAVGRPGQKFLYSDTGFVLLGLILEHIHHMPFHQLLRTLIFDNLGMKDTAFMFYDPLFHQDELAPVIVKDKDIRSYTSLSLDFSGGGLSTTVCDLAKFMDAFKHGKLISAKSYQRMATFNHHFQSGMFYGLGMMELRFEKVFFLLRGLPKLKGHLGVLGVHAWFHPDHGDIYIINMGNISDMVKSFQLLIQMVTLIESKRKHSLHPSVNR
jgi:D-alanyl-D-alanine carboxypeptidase